MPRSGGLGYSDSNKLFARPFQQACLAQRWGPGRRTSRRQRLERRPGGATSKAARARPPGWTGRFPEIASTLQSRSLDREAWDTMLSLPWLHSRSEKLHLYRSLRMQCPRTSTRTSRRRQRPRKATRCKHCRTRVHGRVEHQIHPSRTSEPISVDYGRSEEAKP